ncbi:1873_t:CDS:2 [Rhizophagus irregularis]|nr:1873_t:CDS:2 [Rhizophagus irregularis]
MANETCDSCDENGNILRQEPQVIPKECYIFNNGSTIDTFNDSYTNQNRTNVGHCLKVGEKNCNIYFTTTTLSGNNACGKRILGDKRLSTETMTVDKCIDYCREGTPNPELTQIESSDDHTPTII